MCERIEDTELAIFVRVDNGQPGIVSTQLDIVDQQSDTHATINRARQCIDE